MVYIVFDIICEMLLLDDICIIIPGISLLMMIIINTIPIPASQPAGKVLLKKAGKPESLESQESQESQKAGKLESWKAWKAGKPGKPNTKNWKADTEEKNKI